MEVKTGQLYIVEKCFTFSVTEEKDIKSENE